MICKYPDKDKPDVILTGIGGAVNFIIPELNDVYSGWISKQTWKKSCNDKVYADKDVYLEILKQFIDIEKNSPYFKISMLYSSYNDKFGLWDIKNNKALYDEIRALI